MSIALILLEKHHWIHTSFPYEKINELRNSPMTKEWLDSRDASQYESTSSYLAKNQKVPIKNLQNYIFRNDKKIFYVFAVYPKDNLVGLYSTDEHGGYLNTIYIVEYSLINERKTRVKCVFVNGHGTSCTRRSSYGRVDEIQYNVVPDNMVVLMNCNTTNTKLLYEDFFGLSSDIFEDIKVKYTVFEKKLCMINTIVEFWKNYNYKFCVYPEQHPELFISFKDESDLLNMGVFHLPMYKDHHWIINPDIKNKYINFYNSHLSLSYLSQKCSQRQPFDIKMEHKLVSVQHLFTLNQILNHPSFFPPQDDKGYDMFYIVLVSSCRSMEHSPANDIRTDYAIEMHDPSDPMLHTYMFGKLYDKIVGMRGGRPYPMHCNVLGKRRKFTMRAGNFYTKYKGKEISLLEALSREKESKDDKTNKAIVLV